MTRFAHRWPIIFENLIKSTDIYIFLFNFLYFELNNFTRFTSSDLLIEPSLFCLFSEDIKRDIDDPNKLKLFDICRCFFLKKILEVEYNSELIDFIFSIHRKSDYRIFFQNLKHTGSPDYNVNLDHSIALEQSFLKIHKMTKDEKKFETMDIESSLKLMLNKIDNLLIHTLLKTNVKLEKYRAQRFGSEDNLDENKKKLDLLVALKKIEESSHILDEENLIDPEDILARIFSIYRSFIKEELNGFEKRDFFNFTESNFSSYFRITLDELKRHTSYNAQLIDEYVQGAFSIYLEEIFSKNFFSMDEILHSFFIRKDEYSFDFSYDLFFLDFILLDKNEKLFIEMNTSIKKNNTILLLIINLFLDYSSRKNYSKILEIKSLLIDLYSINSDLISNKEDNSFPFSVFSKFFNYYRKVPDFDLFIEEYLFSEDIKKIELIFNMIIFLDKDFIFYETRIGILKLLLNHSNFDTNQKKRIIKERIFFDYYNQEQIVKLEFLYLILSANLAYDNTINFIDLFEINCLPEAPLNFEILELILNDPNCNRNKFIKVFFEEKVLIDSACIDILISFFHSMDESGINKILTSDHVLFVLEELKSDSDSFKHDEYISILLHSKYLVTLFEGFFNKKFEKGFIYPESFEQKFKEYEDLKFFKLLKDRFLKT